MNHYTDHLGNIRLSYGRDPETNEVAILKESHYYPFACPLRSIRGLQHQGYVTNHKIFDPIAPIGRVNLIPVRNYLDDSYRYTFGGKEEQPELGLNWIDHHARNYDAALGRWMNVDPLGEKMPSWSPYNYAFNNPVYFIDPDGKKPTRPIRPIPPIFLLKPVLAFYQSFNSKNKIQSSNNTSSQRSRSSGVLGVGVEFQGNKKGIADIPIAEKGTKVLTVEATFLMELTNVYGPQLPTGSTALIPGSDGLSIE